MYGLASQMGLSLVEALVATLVLTLIMGLGAPRLVDWHEASQVESAAAALRTDIQYGRSSAVALGQTVRLGLMSEAGGSCYVLHTGGSTACRCSPSQRVQCEGGAVAVRDHAYGAAHEIRITSRTSSMGIESTHGTVTPTATFTVAHRSGKALNVIVNVMGRTRTCVASGALAGHPPC